MALRVGVFNHVGLIPRRRVKSYSHRIPECFYRISETELDPIKTSGVTPLG